MVEHDLDDHVIAARRRRHRERAALPRPVPPQRATVDVGPRHDRPLGFVGDERSAGVGIDTVIANLLYDLAEPNSKWGFQNG
ncbi:MAG: hypothetical protein ABIR68_11070 [Ilumatobacteraceae bacterium]